MPSPTQRPFRVALTGGIASGHNLKHIFSGAVIACLFGWLRQRRPTVPTTAEAAAAH